MERKQILLKFVESFENFLSCKTNCNAWIKKKHSLCKDKLDKFVSKTSYIVNFLFQLISHYFPVYYNFSCFIVFQSKRCFSSVYSLEKNTGYIPIKISDGMTYHTMNIIDLYTSAE